MVNCTCLLCGGVDKLTRPNLLISNNLNCAEASIQVCTKEGADCFSALKNLHSDCCTFNNISIFYERSEQDKYSYPTGNNPVCWICSKPNKVPTIKSMVINILTLQAGTCVQYYHYGRLGHIRPHICSALQALAKVPCGC